MNGYISIPTIPIGAAAPGAANTPTFNTRPAFNGSGGSPFTVTSTTVVSNLNVDRCDGQHLSTIDSPTFATLYLTNLGAVGSYVTNAYITNLGTTTNYTNNAYITNLGTASYKITNAYITTIGSGAAPVTNAYITNLGDASNKVSQAYITTLGSTTTGRVTNAYIATLYLGDLVLDNSWKLDDSTEEILWISPTGKKYKMHLEEVK
jgi:hypothetical protein